MANEKTFEEYVRLAEHYLAIGQTEIFLYRDVAVPDEAYKLVTGARESGSYRLSGPNGVRFSALHTCGLTFSWTVDFEGHAANGTGTAQFDRERIRDVARKLPPEGARNFADFMERSVLPPLKERAKEIRDALNRQQDSVDCVLGLIEYARQVDPAP
ncbi:hypothetical protein XM25_00725 [Devosia sp. H5989]|nr:hypothetical protein XM25_00725 [Devosia sp. H5989]